MCLQPATDYTNLYIQCNTFNLLFPRQNIVQLVPHGMHPRLQELFQRPVEHIAAIPPPKRLHYPLDPAQFTEKKMKNKPALVLSVDLEHADCDRRVEHHVLPGWDALVFTIFFAVAAAAAAEGVDCWQRSGRGRAGDGTVRVEDFEDDERYGHGRAAALGAGALQQCVYRGYGLATGVENAVNGDGWHDAGEGGAEAERRGEAEQRG